MHRTAFSAFFLAFGVAVLPVQSQSRLPYEKAPYDDTVVQCGAMFALLADFYQDAGDTNKSKNYKDKFEKQLKTSEGEFLNGGRPKQEAQKVYQERRGILAAMVEKDTKLAVLLVQFCDQEYPL